MKTYSRSKSKDLQALLPWYVNGTLSGTESQEVEALLENDAHARAEANAWATLRKAVQAQPAAPPSAALRARVMAAIRASENRPLVPHWFTRVWATILTLTVLLFLWGLVQPGVQLQWSTGGNGAAAFRIYRAPAGSNDFDLLYESLNPPAAWEYRYVDTELWHGQRYAYRIEVVNVLGRQISSDVIRPAPLAALPGQLAVLFTSLCMGYVGLTFIEGWSGYQFGTVRRSWR
ncbi:MAG: hypothetical protein JXB35_17440 [Anaerolineae bacterium]|nr:hypothetical protein [Anaerolineae bacterium]